MASAANIRPAFLMETFQCYTIKTRKKLERVCDIVKKSKNSEIISAYKIIKQEIEQAQKKGGKSQRTNRACFKDRH